MTETRAVIDLPHRPAPPSWVPGGRIPALDGLRAVAVGLVLWTHSSQTHGFPGGLFRVLGPSGGVGVDVFFVLSGFLITTLLSRERERARRISLSAFYLRRALRILPAYVCFLLFVAALQMYGEATVSWGDWVAAATYTVNFRRDSAWEMGHIWSLSIEEHFYLLWPPLVALLPRRAAVASLAGVLVLEPLIRWVVILGWPTWIPVLELWTFTRIDAVAAGCLLALVARSHRGRPWLDALARRWPLALGLLLAGLTGARLSGKFVAGVEPSLTAGTLAVLVWACVRAQPRWLEHPFVCAIGIGSYSLYLWQQLFLNPHHARWWNVFPQNLLLVAAAAAASYWVIERPFLRIKDRLHLRRRLPAQTATRTAAVPGALAAQGAS